MVLELKDVLVQRGGICSVFLEDHLFGGEPSNSSSGDVSLFEVFIELHNEVQVHSQGYSSGCIDGIFTEGSSLSEGRSFGHVG